MATVVLILLLKEHRKAVSYTGVNSGVTTDLVCLVLLSCSLSSFMCVASCLPHTAHLSRTGL